jgi:ribosomal protein L14E/L6E/L27E
VDPRISKVVRRRRIDLEDLQLLKQFIKRLRRSKTENVISVKLMNYSLLVIGWRILKNMRRVVVGIKYV